MYDTLWIGCSHSAGLYNMKNTIINSNAGIANRIANHYRQRWKIISFPGDGNFKFMEAIKILDDRRLLSNFRNIIIQQTYEPRLNFYTKETYKDSLSKVVDWVENEKVNETLNAALVTHEHDVFSLWARSFYESHEHNFTKEKEKFVNVAEHISNNIDPRNPQEEFYAEWSKAALDYIKMKAEQNKCNFYTFKWIGSYSTQPKTHPLKGLFKGEEDVFSQIKRVGLQDELSEPGKHPTEKILQFATKILISELDTIGYR